MRLVVEEIDFINRISDRVCCVGSRDCRDADSVGWASSEVASG